MPIGFVDHLVSNAMALQGARTAIWVTDFANSASKFNKGLVYVSGVLRVRNICCADVWSGTFRSRLTSCSDQCSRSTPKDIKGRFGFRIRMHCEKSTHNTLNISIYLEWLSTF